MEKIDEDIELLKLTLAELREEYKDAAEIWKTLELKAQIALTVAGVFLAATLAFVSKGSLSESTRLLLFPSMLALLVTFIRAMMVLKVQEYDAPFDADDFAKRALSSIDRSDAAGVRTKLLLSETIDGWKGVLDGVAAINRRKQGRLGDAYFALVVAALFTTWAAIQQLAAG